MKVLTDISEIDKKTNCGLTIGNFDGLHIGHKKFIQEFKSECLKRSLETVVVTFVPHPLVTLRNKENFLINSYEQRRNFFKKLKVDYFIEIDFSRDFSTLSPTNFLDQFVFKKKNIHYLYLGHDFSFGAKKKGDERFIDSYCKENKIEYYVQNEYEVDEIKVSSSETRECLLNGEMTKAKTLLGREFFVEGLVIKGAGKGKKIGFPTANLKFDEKLLTPGKGVYISQTIIGKMKYFSVTNVGVNPTFNHKDKVVVETHLLDFSNDIYGELVRVIFLKRLRDEKKFSSVNDLVHQIQKDVGKTRKYFEKN